MKHQKLNSLGFMKAIRGAATRDEIIDAIDRYVGYDRTGDFGEQELAAKMKAYNELKGILPGKTRQEARQEARKAPGFTPGMPDHDTKRIGEIKGLINGIVEEIEPFKAQMLNAEKLLQMPLSESDLAEVKKIRYDSRQKYIQGLAQIEPLNNELAEIVRRRSSKREVEFIDANGLVEKRMVPIADIRMLQPKVVTRRDGSKSMVVEVEDLDNLPPELKAIVGARTNTNIKQGSATMNDKKILSTLIKIAKNQQKIIQKLAQTAPGQVGITGEHHVGALCDNKDVTLAAKPMIDALIRQVPDGQKFSLRTASLSEGGVLDITLWVAMKDLGSPAFRAVSQYLSRGLIGEQIPGSDVSISRVTVIGETP